MCSVSDVQAVPDIERSVDGVAVAAGDCRYLLSSLEHRPFVPERRAVADDNPAGVGRNRQCRSPVLWQRLPVDTKLQTGVCRPNRRTYGREVDEDGHGALFRGAIEVRAQVVAFAVEGEAAALLR